MSWQAFNTGLVLDGENSALYHFGMGILTIKRKAAGLSQARLATLAGTSQPQIKRLETGDRKLTREWAQRLAPHLKATAETLLFGDLTVPIVGLVGAGSEAHYYAESQGNLGRARMPPGGGKETVAVEVRGDSLGPALEGWLVYFDERREPPTDDMLGEICVVGLASGQILVKKLMRGRLPAHFDLWPIAAGTPLTDQVVEWAALVRHMMSARFAKVEIVDGDPHPQKRPPKRKNRKRVAKGGCR